jgi:SHS2 domain-containing protein
MPGTHEILEHTADIGFEARADSLAGLFAEAAAALLSIAVATDAVTPRDTYFLEASGDDRAALLVNFLSEILYLFDSDTFAPASCQVDDVGDTRVAARLVGERRIPGRHRWKLIVKAVTYHGLEVVEHDGRWVARVFLDV